MRRQLAWYAFLLVGAISACKGPERPVGSFPEAVLFRRGQLAAPDSIAARVALRERIQKVLQKDPPVLSLSRDDAAHPALVFAQDIALASDRVRRLCHRRKTGEAVLCAVTDVRPARPAELRKANLRGDYALVEIYNYYYNSLIKAFVDRARRSLADVKTYPGAQPAMRRDFARIARAIAYAHPRVREVWDGLGGSDVLVRVSKCERSRHLCYAVVVTPRKGDRSLWVLVDMTELDVIGYRLMPRWDPQRPQIVTERSLQNAVVGATCDQIQTDSLGDWVIHYRLTKSDGIELLDVRYQGRKVLRSAKILDWHVSYPDRKDFGYSDAMGCPVFSAAAVVAFELPEITPIVRDGQQVGYRFVQDYRSPVWPKGCNYRYQNLFEFYNDGSFRIAGVNLGLGCSNNGWYRPVFRIEPALHGRTRVEVWNGSGWRPKGREFWHLQDKGTAYSRESALFRMTGEDGNGFLIVPDRGQLTPGGRGDHAYSYFVRAHADRDEGRSNQPTFGPCCNTTYEQGPERFIADGESLDGGVVFWYVPQMKNSDRPGAEYCWVRSYVKDGYEAFHTYPGTVGPLFVPFQNGH